MTTITKNVRESITLLSELIRGISRLPIDLDSPTDLDEVLELSKLQLAKLLKSKYAKVKEVHRRCYEGRLSDATLNVYKCSLAKLEPDLEFKGRVNLLKGTGRISITLPNKVVINIGLMH